MRIDRRAALRFASAGVIASLVTPSFAETTQYRYDALGRLVLVIFNDGSSVQYKYDSVGNRTQVVRSATTPSDTFTQTIQITGTSGVNLRTLANSAGYGGDKHANVTFQLASGVTLNGAAGNPNGVHAIDSGDWPYTIYQVSLTLQISGQANAGGGRGGVGAGVSVNPGGAGGDAVHCRLPMSVIVNSGGVLRAGGGGGGGASRARVNVGGEWEIYGGGGGGGGQPNGVGGSGGSGANGNGTAGTAATSSVVGNGGAGAYGNDGGNGGAYGAAGTAGDSGTLPGGVGGAAGYGVRKNGHAVSVTNNGTITGAVG